MRKNSVISLVEHVVKFLGGARFFKAIKGSALSQNNRMRHIFVEATACSRPPPEGLQHSLKRLRPEANRQFTWCSATCNSRPLLKPSLNTYSLQFLAYLFSHTVHSSRFLFSRLCAWMHQWHPLIQPIYEG